MAKRFLMWVLGSVFIAVFTLTFIPVSCYAMVLLGIAIAIIPACIIKQPFRITVVACLIASLIASLGFLFLNKNSTALIEPMLKHSVVIQGRITDVGNNSAQDLSRYKINVDRIGDKEVPFYNPIYIYLYTDDFKHEPGEYVSGPIQFFESETEYGFGKEQRVFIAGYQECKKLSFESPKQFNLYNTLYKFRNSIVSKIAYGKEETMGLLKAVCFGDRDDIDSNLYVSLKRIGLSHVMAVSGLHLSFVVLLFGFLFLLLGINYRVRYIIGIFISIFFTVAVGLPASCIRACVMLIVFSIGMALDWFADSITSLSVAAFLILLVNPFSVRDVGFLLSISATAGIITLQAPIEKFLFPPKIGKDHRIIAVYRKITGIFSCSLAAMIATFPIVMVVFGSVSLIAPVANIWLIYPFQFLFVAGILMVLLGWIPFAGEILGFLCDVLYRFIKWSADLLGKFEFSSVSSINWIGIVLLCIFITIFGISLFFYLRHKSRPFMPLFALFLCFCLVFNGTYVSLHRVDGVEIAFVDVGQGDCTVISKGDRAVIFDYGGSSSKRYNLISYLKKKEINSVELLALTHLHSDHTNGIFSLSRNTYIGSVIYPPLEFDSPQLKVLMDELNGFEIKKNYCLTVLDNVEIEVITDAVLKRTSKNENEQCICYKINIGSTSVLVTGDLDGKGELTLLNKDLDCTILKVGHHGSKTSSMYPFLKAVSPEIAVISVGKNSYNLPNETVLSRLDTICNHILITDKEGTICFATNGKYLERVNP